jgi:hypothetical protein
LRDATPFAAEAQIDIASAFVAIATLRHLSKRVAMATIHPDGHSVVCILGDQKRRAQLRGCAIDADRKFDPYEDRT